MTAAFSPGALVAARGREWVVVEVFGNGALTVRPLGGLDHDTQVVFPRLESDLQQSRFIEPQSDRAGPSSEAKLLRDSLNLNLRRGAGPFRSFGRLAFEPRAYQLAPLLMALKLDPIRLLIADDVGIGKTIEAGLIAREMLDRGEVNRLAVMCPPHLVDQWVTELRVKFGIDAVAVTASTANKLERGLPIGTNLFEVYPFTVVSLDLVKADKRRNDFALKCPDFVIVDEAHSCVGTGEGRRQQRFDLLRSLAKREQRHLVLLTATPHSGDTEAYSRLTTLLDPEFSELHTATGERRDQLRLKLGDQLVQRRQSDIEASEWGEKRLFPKSEKKEETYRLHSEAAQFFSDVLDYCAEVTARVGTDKSRQRLAFWGTLALMRCIASSPVAGVQALKTRAKLDDMSAEDRANFIAHASDGESDSGEIPDDDGILQAIEDPALAKLVGQAVQLAMDPRKDEKLKKLRSEVKKLIDDGFNPVIFCRFIATARGVYAALEAGFTDCAIDVITGETASDDRRARVEALGAADAKQRILVATDCLSEGINLQSYFDAVVHYDLSWNPTRHQQREGRVNRFGQKSPTVRSLLIYGEDNPVDGAVLEVIIRKAEQIRKATGVPVPLPDDERAMTEALLKAVLLRRRKDSGAPMLPFSDLPEARKIDKAWLDASAREKQSHTIFAQRALKPAEVIPEWEKALKVLGGGSAETHTFLDGALKRFGAPLQKLKQGYRFKVTVEPGNAAFRDRLSASGVDEDMRITFEPGPEQEFVHRTHPLVSTAAELLFERALDPLADLNDIATLSRCGAWATKAVSQRTTVALLRLRHRLVPSNGKPAMLAEEASALAWTGNEKLALSAEGDAALALLDAKAEGDLDQGVRKQRLDAALARIVELAPDLDSHAAQRAKVLGDDHDRVRAATMRDRRTRVARIAVEPVTPVDIIGLYVLIPDVS
jgi:superfamily II DNA or RNA helicase